MNSFSSGWRFKAPLARSHYTGHTACYAPAIRVGGIKRSCVSDVCLTSICRVHRASIENREFTHDSNTTFKVKRSKVNLQGAGALLWWPH